MELRQSRVVTVRLKTLVIGKSGLVGSHVARAFTEFGDVDGTSFSRAEVPDLVLDIRDARTVMECVARSRPDIVVCAAADPFVDRCEKNPAETSEINVRGVGNVVGAAASVDALLVFFSSDYVFNGGEGPYGEDDPVSPINEYGRQKVAAEDLVAAYPRHLIARISGVFGLEPRRKNFVCRVVDNLRNGIPIRAARDQVLCPTDAESLAIALKELIAAGFSGRVHVTGPEALSRAAFAHRVAKFFSLDSELVQTVTTAELNLAATRPANSALRTDSLRKLVGHGLPPLEDSLLSLKAQGL